MHGMATLLERQWSDDDERVSLFLFVCSNKHAKRQTCFQSFGFQPSGSKATLSSSGHEASQSSEAPSSSFATLRSDPARAASAWSGSRATTYKKFIDPHKKSVSGVRSQVSTAV